jgi:isoleucyl-tRNA synthetase
MPYPSIPSSPDFPEIERGILAFWKKDDTFRASVEQREGCEEWVFYDGPPFANGLPHYGHLLTGYAKDLFPRYQTMRGKQVHRRFGWDTHGLPAELEAERQLGITDKSQIEEMGIAAFNSAARSSVLTYTKEWEEYVTRQARWVDFENDYKTLDVTFMESVVWAFAELYRKGLAYEGYRVLPYCWRDQTPLSNHELRMDDDVYKARQDQSVTVTFPLVGEKAEALGLTGVRALAWTTTPWTLPTNAALAVGPDVEYGVVADAEGREYLLAVDTLGSYRKELGEDAVVTRTFAGRELDGIHYDRLWDHYAEAEGMQNAWRILVADYVATGEGTGIVHQAPAYGEDDQVTCAAAGIPVILSVDDAGRFLPTVAEVAGLQVFEANPLLIKKLRDDDRLLQVKSYEHSYPHCWRCRNPLIYKAVSSWFVRVTEIKNRMLELNQQITWVPENVKDGQFGKWLEGARDWSISRNRYWGSPIPVWKSDDPAYPRVDVYGSLAELEADFGSLPLGPDGEVDLHRPYIDDLVRPNPDDPSGRAMMRRIPDVLDVWFDSGSMPFAQVHYPFENREWFDGVDGQPGHNPADFIVEYIGQTRGWFYLMHVLATALFDRPAFSNVISHGIVLGNDGQKMSKSLRNYPDVNEVFDRDGADAMRWFLMSSSVIRGGNLVVTEEGIRGGVRELLLPLWSTYYFFTLYANSADTRGLSSASRSDTPTRGLSSASRSDTPTRGLSSASRSDTRIETPPASNPGEGFDTRPPAAGATQPAEPDRGFETRPPEAGAPQPAGVLGYTATRRTDSQHVLDRYILAKTREVLEGVTSHLDQLDSPFAAQALRDFGDVLTNWYVRRSRDRFWDGTDRDAFDTLYTVLETLCRMAAPLLPLVTEEIWKGLTGGRSVHLEDWPVASEFPADHALVAAMDRVREIASAGLALRKAQKLRVRLPLARLTVVSADPAALEPFADILADELNVRAVDLEPVRESSLAEYGIERRLTVNARALGPRLGKDVQRVIHAAKAGVWMTEGDIVIVDGTALQQGEYDLVLATADPDAAVAFLADGFVVLDTAVTPELEAEGLARDVIRAVQQARKDAGLNVSDRITLTVVGDPAAVAAIETHRDLIAGETLATTLGVRAGENGAIAVGAGSAVSIELERV